LFVFKCWLELFLWQLEFFSWHYIQCPIDPCSVPKRQHTEVPHCDWYAVGLHLKWLLQFFSLNENWIGMEILISWKSILWLSGCFMHANRQTDRWIEWADIIHDSQECKQTSNGAWRSCSQIIRTAVNSNVYT
jgi:hypothetical protein